MLFVEGKETLGDVSMEVENSAELNLILGRR